MYRDMHRFGRDGSRVIRSSNLTFKMPLMGKMPNGSRIFTCSWSDFFIKEADSWRAEAWNIINLTPQYFYIILTKRPENIASRLPATWGNGWKNVALLVSAEDGPTYRERWEILSKIPAAVRGISAEPLLTQFTILSINDALPQWVITGGESGPGCRLVNNDTFEFMAKQCAELGIPFFHKQNGGTKKIGDSWGGDEISGRKHKELPNAIGHHMMEWR